VKKPAITITFALLAFVLAACGQEERGSAEENDGAPPGEQPSSTEGLVAVGGFTIEGPDGSEIVVPETAVERGVVEDYANEVRPIVEDTARDLSSVIDPGARLENETLMLSVEVEPIERAREAAEEGLEQLREVEPPEELEAMHEQLVTAYEETLPAYENIIEAFDSDDVDVLARAVRESLPDVEQSIAEARTILQELQRAGSQEVPAGQDG
jgi:hypothetical protein